MGIIIVPDSALPESIHVESILLANYKETTDEGKNKIEALVQRLETHSYGK